MTADTFFQRHIPVLGKDIQAKLQDLRVAVIGVGALGSTVSELLVRSGIKDIVLVDPDIVHKSNIHRQTLYNLDDRQKPKALCAKAKLESIYSDNYPCSINAHVAFVDSENIDKIIGNVDMIFDCCDNLETKYLLNDYAIKNNIPLTFGSVEGSTGMVKVIDNDNGCLGCFYQNVTSKESCATAGVLTWSASLIANLQVSKGLNYIIAKAKANIQQENLHIIHCMPFAHREIKTPKNTDCTCCSQRTFSYLDQDTPHGPRILCGGEKIELHVPNLSFSVLRDRFEAMGKSSADYISIHIENTDFLILREGRILVSATSETEARRKCHELLGI